MPRSYKRKKPTIARRLCGKRIGLLFWNQEHHFDAAVLGVGGGVALWVDGLGFAVAHSFHPLCVNTRSGEVFANSQSPFVAEGEVVLLGTAFVSITFNHEGFFRLVAFEIVSDVVEFREV